MHYKTNRSSNLNYGGNKMKKAIISIIISLLFLSLSAISALSLNINKEITPDISLFTSDDIECDIKTRITGGDWQDVSITADTGKPLNFKIDIGSSGGGILVTLIIPYIDDNPMLSYVIGSGSHIPFFRDDSCVIWGFNFEAPAQITYDLNLLKSGAGTVKGIVADIDSEDSDDDSVQVIGQGGCCFPTGTKITMADKSCKNIEDVRIGDRVLSFDHETGGYSSWFVKMLGKPVHPVFNINDGLLELTADHPIFIKKSDGRQGIGAIDAAKCQKSIVFEKTVLNIEIGDNLLDEDGKYIKIESIEQSIEYVQTYNILSFSGTKTFFANRILVFEEHPPNSFTSRFLEFLLEKMPRFTQFLLSRSFFIKIFSP